MEQTLTMKGILLDKIGTICGKYTTPADFALFKETVNMLCDKGIGKGVYQDHQALIDLLSILTTAEQIIKSSLSGAEVTE